MILDLILEWKEWLCSWCMNYDFFYFFFYRIDVILCFSEYVRNDILLEEKYRIDKVCRK